MPHSVADDIAGVIDALCAIKTCLNAEISNYPMPISGCDAQFNHLLSQREKLHRALVALEGQPFIPTPRLPEPGIRIESR